VAIGSNYWLHEFPLDHLLGKKNHGLAIIVWWEYSPKIMVYPIEFTIEIIRNIFDYSEKNWPSNSQKDRHFT